MKEYLATTAWDEIWDDTSKIVYLGPWCLQGGKDVLAAAEKKDLIVPSPWKPAARIKEAADYCHSVYNKILILLAAQMNSLHNVNYKKILDNMIVYFDREVSYKLVIFNCLF